MKSKDYIINELTCFVEKFSKVRVRYEYDENALVHTIEVLPNDIYHLDEDYILWEMQVFEKFIKIYQTENICFISDDALVGIENPIFIKEGLDYAIFLHCVNLNHRGMGLRSSAPIFSNWML